MRSLQGPDEPHQHPVGLSQSSVELGLLPTTGIRQWTW